LIFYKNTSRRIASIKPIVYVKQTNTLIWETSCASGSLALCLSKKYNKAKISQPSGTSLDIRFEVGGFYVGGRVGEIRFLQMVI